MKKNIIKTENILCKQKIIFSHKQMSGKKRTSVCVFADSHSYIVRSYYDKLVNQANHKAEIIGIL